MGQAKKQAMRNGKSKGRPANPDATVVRIDTDSAKAKGGYRMPDFGFADSLMILAAARMSARR